MFDHTKIRFFSQVELPSSWTLYEMLLPISIQHTEYKKKWVSDFDDAVDYYRAQVLVRLRSGDLIGKGLRALVGDEVGEDAFWDHLSDLQRKLGFDDFSELLEPIPTEYWISRNIDWQESSLSAPDRVFVALQFDMDDILRVFPPRSECKVVFKDRGSLMFASTRAQASEAAPVRSGRPAKNWEAIAIYIAQIIQRDGSLPKKQDALAQEICDWYRRSFKSSIGLSTVKAKLAGYYASENIQKSEK
ncbi:MAG: hypothetical protein AAGH41_14100 [Pseudomonadota bacterium]